MIVNIYIIRKLDNKNYIKHDFSVWLRTGSNPADINRFRSHTRNDSTKFFFFFNYETQG